VGITTHETSHGNPGEKRVLPKGLKVALVPASNLPDSDIKYWAEPLPDHPWPDDVAAWAEKVGVGLHEDDVKIEKGQNERKKARRRRTVIEKKNDKKKVDEKKDEDDACPALDESIGLLGNLLDLD
jgi:hypothetical protein